jgi:predicted short-subunit dehydrogenase-like oxidoreductase (DUF2520 family)
MNIGFIGAGKVGFSLGKYFSAYNLPVAGYYSRTPESARQAALFTGTNAYDSQDKLLEDCDAVFFTVPDGCIAAAYAALPKEKIRSKILCHCSGALSAEEAFPGYEDAGAFGYSIHPLFAFSDKYHAYEELADVFFAVEGHPARLTEITQMLKDLGNPVASLDSRKKAGYHAAAAIASNHVVALIDESIEILTDCGFTPEQARKALGPIMLGNLAHVAQDGPVDSLTGPVERCDVSTVRKHLQYLQDPDDKELYRLLSKRLVRIAKRKHPETDFQPMMAALTGEKENV